MSQNNQERIQQINELIVKLDNQRIAGGISIQTIEEIGYKIKKLEDERGVLEKEKLAEDQAERNEKVQANIATYTDVLSEIFETLFPSELYVQIFGLTEYGEKRTEFYQLNQAYYAETAGELNGLHEEELAKRDERFQSLKNSFDQLSEDLTAANNRSRRAEEDTERWIEKYNESERANVETTELLNVTKNKLSEVESNQSELEQRVLDANKQVLDMAGQRDEAIDKFNKLHSSQSKVIGVGSSLKELMGDMRAKNEAKIKSSAELAADGELGFRGKVTFPTTTQQEQPSPETNTTDAGNNQVLGPENEDVKAPQFQTSQAVGPERIPLAMGASSSQGESGETPATQEWVKAEIARAIADIRGEQVA